MTGQDERVKSFFEKDAQDYLDAYRKGAGVRSIPFTRREKAVKEMFHWKDARVLDVGSGPGIFTGWLLDRGCEVWTLDIAREMVHLAQVSVAGHEREDKSFFVQGSILELPFPDKFFNAGLCVGVVEYIENLEQALKELARCLSPGGHLIITGPNGKSLIAAADRAAAAVVNFFFRPLLIRSRGRGFLEFPYFHRAFDPQQFVEQVGGFGFELRDKKYTNFRSRILRGPLQGIADWAALKLEQSLATTRLETLGTNLIACFERK